MEKTFAAVNPRTLNWDEDVQEVPVEEPRRLVW